MGVNWQTYRPWALAFWAAASLTFMAGMGIGSGVFTLVTVLAIARRTDALRPVFRSGLLWATLAFFIVAAFSVVAAKLNPPLGLRPDGYPELTKAHYFLLPFFAALALTDPRIGGPVTLERHPLWKALIGMGVFVSILGVIQYWGAYLFPESWLTHRFFRVAATGFVERHFHAQGLTFFHLSFASIMSFLCCYAWARLLWPLSGDGWREKRPWIALALLGSLALFYSYSRIGWVSLALMPVIFGFLKRPRWGIGAIFLVAVLSAVVWFSSLSMRERWRLGMEAVYEREGVWLGALEMVKERPLTGVGFGKSGFYSRPYVTKALGKDPDFTSHAHNNLLDMLASMGVPGLLAYLTWWGVLLVYLLRAYRGSPEELRWLPAACLVALLIFQVNGLTQVNFFDGKSQHSLMLWAGIALALHWRGQAKPGTAGKTLP